MLVTLFFVCLLCMSMWIIYFICGMHSQYKLAEPKDSSHRRHVHRQEPMTSSNPQSVQVLNYEASLIQQQVCSKLFDKNSLECFRFLFCHLKLD